MNDHDSLARRLRSVTAAKIVDATGCSRATANNWRTGTYLPERRHIAPLAKLLGMTPGALLALVDGDEDRLTTVKR